MALDGFPFQHSIAPGCVGAGLGAAVTVPGIRAGDSLYAVIKYKNDGTVATPLDTTGYVVTADTITAAGISTTGFKVCVVWGSGN